MAGLIILLVLFSFASLISCCCNNSECLKRRDWLKIVVEEERKIFSDELRKKAKEQLQERINDLKKNPEWAEYTLGSNVFDYLAPKPKPQNHQSSCVPPSETASVPLADFKTSGAFPGPSTSFQQHDTAPLL